MSNPEATPRTDAVEKAWREFNDWDGKGISPPEPKENIWDFARQLERELAEANGHAHTWMITCRTLEDELAQERAARLAAEAALKHILWIKDCGVDARDEHGVFRNYPDVERDSMYDIAKKALAQGGGHD